MDVYTAFGRGEIPAMLEALCGAGQVIAFDGISLQTFRSSSASIGEVHKEWRTYPMPSMLVRHKVHDYARWKTIFDEHGATRQASGSRGGRLFRNADDPNEVVAIFEWDDLEKARQLAQSDDLRETMQRAGVADRPDVYFLEEVEAVPV
jgi:heme-degrading monooxygenase HmoA